MNTFKEQFGIPSNQIVEFLNIPLDGDLEAFIDPFLIANNRQFQLFDKIYHRLKSFFAQLNKDYIVLNNRNAALLFLDNLHEPNEYHLGYSKSNKGRAISGTRAETIFDALRNNRFAQAGISITNEAHNILLLVAGIGQDIMSDTISNVCRDIFADFTYNQCQQYNIPVSNFTRHYFNHATGAWDSSNYLLPSFQGKCIILLPKIIISSARSYTNHYNHFVAANYISKDILNGKIPAPLNKAVIRTLKDGTRKAIIKRIVEAYGKPKEELIEFVKTYNGSLDAFLDYVREHYPAINLDDLE